MYVLTIYGTSEIMHTCIRIRILYFTCKRVQIDIRYYLQASERNHMEGYRDQTERDR